MRGGEGRPPNWRKEEVKPHLFADNIIKCTENPKDSTQKN